MSEDPLIIPDDITPPNLSAPPVEPAKDLVPHYKSVPRSRLVVVQTFYHQTEDDFKTTAVGGNFIRWLATDEAVYNPQRKVRVGQEWQEVDVGWIKTIGLLVITNHVPKVKMKAESVTSKAGVLEVCLSSSIIEHVGEGVGMWAKVTEKSILTPHLLLPPGEAYPIIPIMGNKVHIRCREGEGVYSVFTVEG